MVENPLVTFVCCAESGSLEAQLVRMIESLRRWGGRFANAPIIIVTPRFGPPLTRKTHQIFEKYQVEYIRFNPKSKYSWYPYLNKPYALVTAEERSTSEFVCWVDADLLFLGEPNQLIPNEGEDFLACASDKNLGTSGPGDTYEAFWQELCREIGLDINDLPWVTTELEGERIRLYWNGGVLFYRRSTHYGKYFLETCIKLLDALVVANKEKYWLGIHEQISIGLAMVKMGIVWRSLPYSHNYHIGSLHYGWYKEEDLKKAKIVHYHDAMWPYFWPEFMKCMHATHPEVADWLDSIGPMKNEAPSYCRSVSKFLDYYRRKQELAYKKLCRVV